MLELQQALVDADYFASVAVSRIWSTRKEGVVPIDVMLIPAKRTVYTASVYVSTDTGPGTKLGIERRWFNKRGHKLSAEVEYSARLQEISTKYRIPKPGLRNRNSTSAPAIATRKRTRAHRAWRAWRQPKSWIAGRASRARSACSI